MCHSGCRHTSGIHSICSVSLDNDSVSRDALCYMAELQPFLTLGSLSSHGIGNHSVQLNYFSLPSSLRETLIKTHLNNYRTKAHQALPSSPVYSPCKNMASW